MTIRGFVYLLIGVCLGVFTLANWTLIAQPTTLNLLVTQVDAPLGIVMLGFMALVVAINLLLLEAQRFAWARQHKTLDAEVSRLRALTDDIEASRLRSLTESFEREMAAVRVRLDKLDERLSIPA